MIRKPLMLLAVTALTIGGTCACPSSSLMSIARAAAAATSPVTISTTRPVTRAGAGGPLVQPVATCKWSDLLSVAVRRGNLEFESNPPPALAGYLINGKAIDVEIADAHEPYWRLQGIRPQRQRQGLPGGGVIIAGGGAVRIFPGRAAGGHANVGPAAGAAGGAGGAGGAAKPGAVDFSASQIGGDDAGDTPRPSRLILMDGEFRLRGQMSMGGKRLQIDFHSYADRTNCVLQVRESRRGRRGAGVSMEAGDLQQLRRQHAAEVRRYLEPMLIEISGGDNPLRPQAGDVYRVFELIPPDSGAAEEVNRLVEQCDALEPAVREAASAELNQLGRAGVLAALRVDRLDLSAEQSLRLDAFIARHQSVADLEAARQDPLFLADCLEDQDRAVRAAALAQLRAVTGHEIGFDIDAPPDERAAAAAAVASEFLPRAAERGED